MYLFYRIISAKPNLKSFEVVRACAYIIGAEVILRMTNSGPFYEASKYIVIIFSITGLFYSGFNKKASPYLLYILLLIPSIYLSLYLLDISGNVRKAIAFNLSGPVCLGVSALLCYDLSITKKQLESIVNFIVYPLISTLVFVIMYNPNVAAVSSGTGSNFDTSGGFGPNQMSTVLGLGFFLMTVRFFYFSKTKLVKYLDLFLILIFAFRAIVTFSRGGVYTAILMILFFIISQYKSMDEKNKKRMITSIFYFHVLQFDLDFSTDQLMG